MITFKLENEEKVLIMRDGKEVGHIFTPSGSNHTNTKAIQVCGASEIFDFWGCGVFKGYKDIQLLFDDYKMKGTPVKGFDTSKCLACYMDPCACEQETKIDQCPFKVKREKQIFIERL